MIVQEPFVDFEDEPDPELNRITNAIIGACIEVHRHLGAGYPESYYEKALEREFDLRGIVASKQHPFEVAYKGITLGEGRIDFLVEGCVILEMKAVESLAPVHTAQAIAYLRATKCRLALIINFNVKVLKDGIRRVAL
jgi:GxxExxY protein